MLDVIKAGLCSALLFTSLPSLAQQYYLVSDTPCRVGLTAEASSADSVAEVPCGTAIKVLQRKAGRVQVVDESGSKGWVNGDNLSDMPPAEMQLRQLTDYQKKLENEMAQLRAQVDELSAKSARLVEALLAAQGNSAGER